MCCWKVGYWGKIISNSVPYGCLGGVVEPDKSILELISKSYDGIQIYSNLEESFKDSYDGYIIAHSAETHFDLSKKIISLATVY